MIRSANDESDDSVPKTVDTTSPTYRITDLVPGETYSFSIRSKGRQGRVSKESPQVQAQTGE